jgi:hypothetical protein
MKASQLGILFECDQTGVSIQRVRRAVILASACQAFATKELQFSYKLHANG